jgi:hypothetical protein
MSIIDKEKSKKAFDAWESTTAGYVEKWMKSPLLLAPIGTLLTQAMRLKQTQDRVMTACWSLLGLPTKRDQERTLFALHQLESRLLDLEEKLDTSGNNGNGNKRSGG